MVLALSDFLQDGLGIKGHRFQTMTFKRFSSLPRDESLSILTERYAGNLRVIYAIMQQCVNEGWTYRVSSSIFPLMTHPDAGIVFDELDNADELRELFAQCRELKKANNLRISCHPDQFNVLASLNDESVDRTITELNHHGWFMDQLGAERSHEAPINIHVNRSSGNLEDIATLFRDNLARCDESVTSRLTVENEDKGVWSVRNLINIFYPIVGVPVTFDNLHHLCNDGGMSEQEAFEACLPTWKNARPLFHYCETMPGQPLLRKHADYPVGSPNSFGHEVDFDIELKAKDRAIQRLASETSLL